MKNLSVAVNKKQLGWTQHQIHPSLMKAAHPHSNKAMSLYTNKSHAFG